MIFELSDSSLLREEQKAPPSPIMTSCNVTRQYESFECHLDVDASREQLHDVTSRGFSRGNASRDDSPNPLISYSFDLLQRSEATKLLDSSQKEEEYYETMLDAELEEGTTPDREVVKEGSNSSSYDQIETPASSTTGNRDEKNSTDTEFKSHSGVLRDECARVLDDLTHDVERSVEIRCWKKQEEKQKPMSPMIGGGRGTLGSVLDVVEQLEHEATDQCARKEYDLEEFHLPLYNYRDLPISRDTLCRKSGRVSAAVNYFNGICSGARPAPSKKLAPLPYGGNRDRKGSFKMGRPSGGELKLDLPTKLKLPPGAGRRLTNSAFKGSRRKSRSLDSLVEETYSFHQDDVFRPPSPHHLGEVGRRVPLGIKSGNVQQDASSAQLVDFLDSSPAKRVIPHNSRSRSPMLPLSSVTVLPSGPETSIL